MHPVVTRITVNDPQAARSHMREVVVPSVSQSPGFVARYWTGGDDGGMSTVVFDSEDGRSQTARTPAS
jgi:hypothetical protein